MGNWKQYGIVIFGFLLALGFGGSMFAQNYSGTSSSPNNQQTTRNFTEPSQNFKVGSFNKSFTEQVVISARSDKAFVNAYYSTPEQKESLKDLKAVTNNFGDRVYVQVVNSSLSSEILTRNGIVNFPKVVVVGGAATQRGVAPRQAVIPGPQYDNITQVNVERALCSVLVNLKGQAARCQAIGAF